MSKPSNSDSADTPAATALAEDVWYPCSCHCGATSFKILHEPLQTTDVAACNCSICEKNGYILTYVFRNQIEYIRGWGELKNYRFASKTRDHKFCGTCGTSIGIDFLGRHKAGDMLAINVRVIQGVDITKLNVLPVNGKEYQAEYNE